jgi:starch phosphorylase
MAHLAVVGSHSVNGVSKLHSEILQNDLLKLFYEDTPDKFNNKTNGITHRRWLLSANPELAGLVNETIGPDWVRRPDELTKLLPYTTDAVFQERLALVRRKRKEALAKLVGGKYGIILDADSIFDVQVKRIHLYKRQLLNVLRILELYNRLRDNPSLDIRPRTFIFAGKAAPGYYLAKRVIKLINTLAAVVNGDVAIGGKLKIVFIENYNVSTAEIIIPAADISEQISTAGKEASGTSNMKFMLNGAITVGTLDGANVEILEAVGTDNIYIFGLDTEAVAARLREGSRPLDVYNGDMRLQRCVNQLIDGTLSPVRDDFRSLYDHLLYGGGEFFELEDFAAFIDVQDRVSEVFAAGPKRWQMAAANIAAAGAFSSDRTVHEYAQKIWCLTSAPR